MNPFDKIAARVFGGQSQEDQALESIYVVMRKFRYTLEDIKELPLPTFYILLELINKENKALKKKLESNKK